MNLKKSKNEYLGRLRGKKGKGKSYNYIITSTIIPKRTSTHTQQTYNAKIPVISVNSIFCHLNLLGKN